MKMIFLFLCLTLISFAQSNPDGKLLYPSIHLELNFDNFEGQIRDTKKPLYTFKQNEAVYLNYTIKFPLTEFSTVYFSSDNKKLIINYLDLTETSTYSNYKLGLSIYFGNIK